MSHSVWRIGSDTPGWQADELSGAGAKASGGRWNLAGTAVVYASSSRALACLETIVHFNAGGLPLNRYLVEIVIPAAVWGRAQRFDLAVGWDAEPAGQVSLRAGAAWLKSAASAVFLVPSVIVPEEMNVLINPAHADAAAIAAFKRRKWLYDPRLTKRN